MFNYDQDDYETLDELLCFKTVYHFLMVIIRRQKLMQFAIQVFCYSPFLYIQDMYIAMIPVSYIRNFEGLDNYSLVCLK